MQSAIESNACVAVLWAAFFIARRQRKHETKGEPYAL